MKPSQRKHIAEASTGLGDSAFEVIPHDEAFLPSDDEDDHTESLASTDGYTGDDGSSVIYTEDEQENETEGSGEDVGVASSEYSLDSSNRRITHVDGGGTTQASVLAETQSCPLSPTKRISSSKPEGKIWKESMEIEVFDNSNMPIVLRDYRMSSLKIVRHLTRSGCVSRLNDPFRVWYFGDPDHKTDILDKIGSALYVGKSLIRGVLPTMDGAVRYNVTPVSSFTRDVALLPSSGIDLYVTECAIQHVESGKNGEHATVMLLLEENMELEIRPDGSVRVPSDSLDDFHFPDIAVFCHTPSRQCMDANYGHELLSVTREVISHLDIPVLDISSASSLPKRTEHFAFDSRSLYMSLEGQLSLDSELEVVALFPISLEMFRELDPTLLNQHLNCIIHSQPKYSTWHSRHNSFVRRLVKFTAPRVGDIISRHFRAVGFIAALLTVTLWLAIITSTFPMVPLNVGGYSTQAPGSTVVATLQNHGQALQASSTDVHSTTAHIPTSLSSSRISASTAIAEKGLGQPLLSTSVVDPNPSFRFKVYITGSNYLTLIPPKSFTALRRQPRLLITVSRREELINAEISGLENSIHLIKVPRSELSGSINITITTTSKPKLNQTIQVNFGTPWLDLYPFNRLTPPSDFLERYRLFGFFQMKPNWALDHLSNISDPMISCLQKTADRIEEFGRVAILYLQPGGGATSGKVKRLVNTSLKTAVATAGALSHRLQGLAVQVSSVHFPRIHRSTTTFGKSALISDARRKARTLSTKFHERVTAVSNVCREIYGAIRQDLESIKKT